MTDKSILLCTHVYAYEILGFSPKLSTIKLGVSISTYNKWKKITKTLPVKFERLYFENFQINSILVDVEYVNCEFYKVSFHKVLINRSKLIQSTFRECYFRETVIQNSKLVGSQFYSCNFKKTKISSTDIKYIKFSDTFIDTKVIDKKSFPSENNLSFDIYRNLKTEALRYGNDEVADYYFSIESRLIRKHLFEIFQYKTSYIKGTYLKKDRKNAFEKWLIYSIFDKSLSANLRLRWVLSLLIMYFAALSVYMNFTDFAAHIFPIFKNKYITTLTYLIMDFLGLGNGLFYDSGTLSDVHVALIVLNQGLGFIFTIIITFRIIKVLTRRTV